MSAVWGILLAAGSGARFGGPKQYQELGGQTLLQRSLAPLLECCDGVVLVVPGGSASPPPTPSPGSSEPSSPGSSEPPSPGNAERASQDGGDQSWGSRVVLVAGGDSRAASVRAGLAAVPAGATVIVVADAAHPLASPSLVRQLVAQVQAGADGAIPGLPLTEVIGRVSDDGVLVGSLPRAGHVLVQTPHAFRADLLRRAHAGGADGVEDSAMVAALDVDGRPARVVVLPGEPANLHVTTAAELELARRLV